MLHSMVLLKSCNRYLAIGWMKTWKQNLNINLETPMILLTLNRLLECNGWLIPNQTSKCQIRWRSWRELRGLVVKILFLGSTLKPHQTYLIFFINKTNCSKALGLLIKISGYYYTKATDQNIHKTQYFASPTESIRRPHNPREIPRRPLKMSRFDHQLCNWLYY